MINPGTPYTFIRLRKEADLVRAGSGVRTTPQQPSVYRAHQSTIRLVFRETEQATLMLGQQPKLQADQQMRRVYEASPPVSRKNDEPNAPELRTRRPPKVSLRNSLTKVDTWATNWKATPTPQ